MLLVSFCNSPHKHIGIVDPLKENVAFIDLGIKCSGATGICKTPTGYAIGLQHYYTVILMLNNNFEFDYLYIPQGLLDVHSLEWHKERLFIVSTGSNSVHRVKINNLPKNVYCIYQDCVYQEYQDCLDIVHLNSIAIKKNSIICSKFGYKEEGQKWSDVKNGKIFDILTGKVIKKTIWHPHTVKYIDNCLAFCESQKGTVNYGNSKIQLDGYTRGIAWDNEFLYVGTSNSRNVSRSTGEENKDLKETKCGIWVINRNNLSIFKKIIIDEVEEIYDIQSIY